MLPAIIDGSPNASRVEDTLSPTTSPLYDLLSNHLVLDHTAPYLPASARLSLAATNRAFRDLVLNTPGVFRHLDLTRARAAQFEIDGIDRGGEVWRNVQLDENLTEDECVAAPVFPRLPCLPATTPSFDRVASFARRVSLTF